jgi:TatD DNase family protein
VVHCFTGSAADAAAYLARGLDLGVAGTVCMPRRGRALRESVLPMVPLSRLLVETDAPFMHPVRGQERDG